MSKASVAHRYDDPRDAITAPHRFMGLTHYYVDRWLPELGERGHVIVTVLRRMGYLDRERDVERGGIEIEQEDLAALCGLKLRTLQREFADENGRPVNPALHLFVQREKQYHRNGAGRILRDKTVYVVQMKDPVHPSDREAFQEECRRREKGHSPGEQGRSRQLGGNSDDRSRQIGGEERQPDARSRQSGATARQSGGKYNVESDSYRPLETPNTPAARSDSLALFEEGGDEREQTFCLWEDLTPAEQQPCRDQAKAALHKYALEAGPERWARIGPRQEEVRARNIYEEAQKGQQT